MSTIRPLSPTDDEYTTYAALVNAVNPDLSVSAAHVKQYGEGFSEGLTFERIVLDEEGEIPAAGRIQEDEWAHVPGKYYLGVIVHPDRRREGLGTRLYAALLERLSDCDPVPSRLVTSTREDQPGALAMLDKHGYQQTRRVARFSLDVRAFDPTPFEQAARRAREAGIEILPLSELIARDADWEDKLYELDWEIMRDLPSGDPPTRLSREAWRRFLDMGIFLPDATMIARDAERWVGIGGLAKRVSNDHLYQDLTGVLPDYRDRGIVTALSLRVIACARDLGASTIESASDEQAPLYQLNRALGFEPQPAWLGFERPWEGAMDWIGETRAVQGPR